MVKNDQKYFNNFTLNKIISQLSSSHQMVSAILKLVFFVLKSFCDLQTSRMLCILQSSMLDRKRDFKRHFQGSTILPLFQMCIMTVKPTYFDNLVWVYVLNFHSSCFLSPFFKPREHFFSLRPFSLLSLH